MLRFFINLAKSYLILRINKRYIFYYFLNRTGTTTLFAEEMMDGGSQIKLNVFIDEEKGCATCDFRFVLF